MRCFDKLGTGGVGFTQDPLILSLSKDALRKGRANG